MPTNHPTSPSATAPSSQDATKRAPPTTTLGSPPPWSLPPVPDGFVAVNPADLRGHRPMQTEMAAVPDALADLQDFPDYEAVFGIAAPPAGELAAQLREAAEWTAVLAESVAWTTYARSQQGIAWKEALRRMEKLKRPFELAAEANPGLLGNYPGLARLLGASSVVGKRAAASRARNKKAQEESASPAPVASTPSGPTTPS